MDRGEMITRPAAVEPETQDEDQLSKSNRGLQQQTEISELCRTLRSVVSALCHLIPVLEKLHNDIRHDQGLKRNIQDLQHESDLPKMEMKSNSHQYQTPVSSNTTDIIQPATPDEPETPSLHQPSLPAHYGMNGGVHQSPETITAPTKPVAAPLDTTHQTSALTKSDTTSATSMLGTVSTVLTAPIPSEVASSPTTVGSAAPTFTNSSAFAPSSDVTTGTVDFKLPLISLPPAAPPVQEDPTVHVVVDEDQARVQPPEMDALQTPAPVSAVPQTVPKSVLVEPTQEAPAPSSSPSGQEAVVETPYFGTASSVLSTPVPGGFATPVLGQAPRISSIKASDFSFKPSSCGKQGGFGQFNFSGTSSSSNQPLISGTPADISLREKGVPVCGTVDEDPATFRKLATRAFQSQTPVLALNPTVSRSVLAESTKKVPAASTVLKPQSFIKAAHFTYKPSTCEKQSSFGKFNNSAPSSSSGLQSNNGSCNLAITERQLGINTTPSPEQEGPTVHGNVDENQAPDRKPDKQTYQTRLPFLALPSTMPSSPLLKPTQEEPAASICPSSQELVFPFTAVETPASGVLSSGDFATPVFGQPPTVLGPQSSMTTSNLSFRPSTCGMQKGFGQSSINEASSSFGLQSRVNNTSSFGQSSGSTQVNPSSQNVSPVNFSFHPTSPSRGHQSVRSQPNVSDVDFSYAPWGSNRQSALDETPASSTFRRRRRNRRRRNHSSPMRSSSEELPFAGREEMWSSSRTTSYIQSGRGRRNEQISVTVQNSSRSLINQSRNHSRGFIEQRRVVRLQEYYQEYLY